MPSKSRVLERVILHVHREMALAASKRDALRHRPARERAVALEPKVVVKTSRGVPLDHETRVRARRLASPNGSGVFPGRRFRRYSSRLTCGLSPEAQRVLYQLAARCAFSLLRPNYGPGISLWKVGKTVKGLGEASTPMTRYFARRSPPPFVRVEGLDLLECSENALLEELRGRIGVA